MTAFAAELTATRPSTIPLDTIGANAATSITHALKDELSHVAVRSATARRAQVAALLRLGDGFHIASGGVVIAVEVDRVSTAQRLCRDIFELYGYTARARPVRPSDPTDTRTDVRVVKDAEALARQTGLIDRRGRPARGLPAQVVTGNSLEIAAAWRGAFLARGAVTNRAGVLALEVGCPGPETAAALVGAARRLGVRAKADERRGIDRVVVRDEEVIGFLLTRMGTQQLHQLFRQPRPRRQGPPTSGPEANLEDANLRRAAHAAAATAARAQRALEILGTATPEHLAQAGALRVEHRTESLDALGRRADPPLTKDAMAGRIRRLIAMADRKASRDGIPNTTAS